MSIVRTERTGDFTVIPNELINDPDLDGDALGLLVFLLSKPADWWVKVEALSSVKRFGAHGKIVKTLQTLRTLGYAKLTRLSSGHTEWIITDSRSQSQQNRHIPKNGMGECEPHSEKPNVEKPNVAFRNVLQKKDLDKELSQTKRTPLPPKGNGAWKVDDVELPAGIPRDTWQAFCQHRREIRKPITQQACCMLLKRLLEMAASGHDVAAILETSIANGWQSVHEPKGKPVFVAPTVSRQARRVYQ